MLHRSSSDNHRLSSNYHHPAFSYHHSSSVNPRYSADEHRLAIEKRVSLSDGLWRFGKHGSHEDRHYGVLHYNSSNDCDWDRQGYDHHNYNDQVRNSRKYNQHDHDRRYAVKQDSSQQDGNQNY